MDVSNIANLATAISTSKTDQSIAIAVMKKAMNIQQASAAVLLEALPPIPVASLPPHLGQNINTKA